MLGSLRIVFLCCKDDGKLHKEPVCFSQVDLIISACWEGLFVYHNFIQL